MRILVALAVVGVCSALPQQAYNPSYTSYGTPDTSHYQPKWTGPLASSVPAGVNGEIIPVSDTYEVSAARNAFFNAYQNQLAAVGGIGYGAADSPAHHSSSISYSVPAHHGYSTSHSAHTHQGPSYSHASFAHIDPTYSLSASVGAHGQVTDTPEVAAAKAQFFYLYNQQAAAAAAAPDDYAPTNHGLSYSHAAPAHHGPTYSSSAYVGPHGQLFDTHEYSTSHSAPTHQGPSYSHASFAHIDPTYSLSASVGAHGQVTDTPEVAAAKAQFFHLYNQQAAAAAAAPDDYASH